MLQQVERYQPAGDRLLAVLVSLEIQHPIQKSVVYTCSSKARRWLHSQTPRPHWDGTLVGAKKPGTHCYTGRPAMWPGDSQLRAQTQERALPLSIHSLEQRKLPKTEKRTTDQQQHVLETTLLVRSQHDNASRMHVGSAIRAPGFNTWLHHQWLHDPHQVTSSLHLSHFLYVPLNSFFKADGTTPPLPCKKTNLAHSQVP